MTGTLLPASLLVGVGFLDCSHSTLAVTLLTLGVAMTGCLHGAGLHISFADLSPRHAGVLYGFSNTIATIPGFVAPIIIGFITRNVSTSSRKYQWRFLGFIMSVGILLRTFLPQGIPTYCFSIVQLDVYNLKEVW